MLNYSLIFLFSGQKGVKAWICTPRTPCASRDSSSTKQSSIAVLQPWLSSGICKARPEVGGQTRKVHCKVQVLRVTVLHCFSSRLLKSARRVQISQATMSSKIRDLQLAYRREKR